MNHTTKQLAVEAERLGLILTGLGRSGIVLRTPSDNFVIFHEDGENASSHAKIYLNGYSKGFAAGGKTATAVAPVT